MVCGLLIYRIYCSSIADPSSCHFHVISEFHFTILHTALRFLPVHEWDRTAKLRDAALGRHSFRLRMSTSGGTRGYPRLHASTCELGGLQRLEDVERTHFHRFYQVMVVDRLTAAILVRSC